MKPEPLMTTREVAEFLSVTVNTLEKWRSGGEGPTFIRVNGHYVRYRPADLRAWLDQHKVEVA